MVCTSQDVHSMHVESQPITEAGLPMTSGGGREVSPCVQGCLVTSAAQKRPVELQKGEGRAAEPEFKSLPWFSKNADPCGKRPNMSTAKRVVLLLNVSPPPQEAAACEAAGLTVLHLPGFGVPQVPSATLMTAKKMIREGRVL